MDERNPKHIKKLTEQLFGEIYADKSHFSKALWEMLFANGMQLTTKVRKEHGGRLVKRQIMELKDKLLIRKRAIIETINDEVKNLYQIRHTRHRSINNLIMNILSELIARCLKKNRHLILKKSKQTNFF